MSSTILSVAQGLLGITLLANSFPKFLELPSELRQIIWSFAIPSQRVVSIACFKRFKKNRNSGRGRASWFKQVRARTKPPALLSVNFEARRVALRYFTPAFADNLYRPTYFNFDRDSLFFEDLYALKAFISVLTDNQGNSESMRVCHIILGCGDFSRNVRRDRRISNSDHRGLALSCFPNLESLIIRNDNGDQWDFPKTPIEVLLLKEWASRKDPVKKFTGVTTIRKARLRRYIKQLSKHDYGRMTTLALFSSTTRKAIKEVSLTAEMLLKAVGYKVDIRG